MFDLTQSKYEKINDMFKQDYGRFIDSDFEARIKKAISVLHFKYLFGACKEAYKILPKTDQNNINLFNLIISIYNKRRRTHQAKFFLLHCFENALRSTLAISFSNTYNQNGDEWFLQTDKAELRKILSIVQRKDYKLIVGIDPDKIELFLDDFLNLFDKNLRFYLK